jgi:hypothetical protein
MHDALIPLVEARWLDEAPTSAAEVAGLRTIVDRNLEEARGPLKYPDTRFWLAYQAVLAAATIVIRAHGARVRRERQHERTFAALRQLAISGVSDRARYYDDCRTASATSRNTTWRAASRTPRPRRCCARPSGWLVLCAIGCGASAPN